MRRKILAILLSLALSAAAVSCAPAKKETGSTGKLSVLVTFDALKEFARAVGGDKVDVSVIVPDGTEPHDFEPKAQDLIGLKKATVFIMNGFGMESWAESAVKASGNSALLVADTSAGISPIAAGEGEKVGQNDPHIWLSLKCAETMAANIRDVFVKADPANAAYYKANCDAFTASLESLYSPYQQKFAALQNKNFVTGHAAFAYLCRDFGLTQRSVEDVFAEGEPSAQQMTALITYCKTNHVTTIFSESLMSPDIADTLAREVGAKVKAIYTIESAENSKSYLDRMSENLQVIYDSMK
jgi:zinc transport system substrate-binding protein